MLFVCNPQNYIFEVDPSAQVNVDLLKEKGCLFFDDLQSLYQKSAEVQDLTLAEVEGCHYTISYTQRDQAIVCMDQRGFPMLIEEPIEDFIINFEM